MKTDEDNSLKKGMLKIWIIWGAMFTSLCIYIAICHLLEPTWIAVATPDFPVDTLKNLLYAAAFIILLLSNYIRKYIMKSHSSARLTSSDHITSMTTMPPVLIRYQIAVLISLALSESIAIFGIIIFLLTKDMNTFYIFIAISAAAMLYHVPKQADI